MIGALFNALFSLVINLVNVILAPIDAIIANAMPALGDALSYVNAMFNMVINGIGWVIGLSMLPPLMFQILLAYFTFLITVPLAISVIKEALIWYDTLKP